jgi:hypothetical protein
MAKKIGNLNSLHFALSKLIDEPMREDEFTCADFYAEAIKIDPALTKTQAQNRIRGMLANGELVCRKVRHNGKQANAYTKV